MIEDLFVLVNLKKHLFYAVIFKSNNPKINDMMPLAPEKIWKFKVKHLRICGNSDDEALNTFHAETTSEAAQFLRSKNNSGKFRSLYLSLSDDAFKLLSADLDEFIMKIKNKYSNDFLKGKKIFKINVQAYPITDTVE